jgi:hypothetical protein
MAIIGRREINYFRHFQISANLRVNRLDRRLLESQSGKRKVVVGRWPCWYFQGQFANICGLGVRR